MIIELLPSNRQIVPKGSSPNGSSREIFEVDWYAELMGGLGDALLRVYAYDGHYASLEHLAPGQKAVVSLMCHNPGLLELFQWHPAQHSNILDVINIGFKTSFHPWENSEYRISQGLPLTSPCPVGPPPKLPIKFYENPRDARILSDMAKGKYIILHPSAGSEERNIPALQSASLVSLCNSHGYTVYLLGSSRYHKDEDSYGAIRLIDSLSVPGMILAVRRSAGVITSHTSVTHVAWYEHRPVFLIYPPWIKDAYVSKGAVGYMSGINRPDTDHMLFSEYSSQRVHRWLDSLGK